MYSGAICKDARAESSHRPPEYDLVLGILKRLDAILIEAVESAKTYYGSDAAADAFRGFYITEEDIQRLFKSEPAAVAPWGGFGDAEGGICGALPGDANPARLKNAFQLSDFEMNALLVCLAPELDLRYQRLYAYLQDDVSKKRPTVNLVLDLLCSSAASKFMRRIHFEADGALIRQGLIRLVPDRHQVDPPFLEHFLKPDEQVVRYFLGQQCMDRRLAEFCRLLPPAAGDRACHCPDHSKGAMADLVSRSWENSLPLRLYFHGKPGSGKRRAAEALAGTAGAPLLFIDTARIDRKQADFRQLLRVIRREAWMHGAIVYWHNVDALDRIEDGNMLRHLWQALKDDPGVTLMSGRNPWRQSPDVSLEVLVLSFAMPDCRRLRTCWDDAIRASGSSLNQKELDLLAGRFRLTPDQITDAVATARHMAWINCAQATPAGHEAGSRGDPTLDDYIDAARTQLNHKLGALAQKIEPRYVLSDIVLPRDAVAQLAEICQRVKHSHQVLSQWGFNDKLSLGKGTHALFVGPSGTGKTMAAEVIATELKYNLYKIDLSGVVSKYIGETEKNVDRIFKAADHSNAILFFDEADALFGKRSEVRDAHDRYANIEVSYLLQKMEAHEGVTVLATNLRQNLDMSFLRRVSFTLHFPFPDEESRRRIWAGIWPHQTPLATDVNFGYLAKRFKLSGGNIKNIALAAAFLAAEDGCAIAMQHIVRALYREYQKMGKPLSEAEFQGLSDADATAQQPVCL
jgi:AAA+ superfamily predicted ATPase